MEAGVKKYKVVLEGSKLEGNRTSAAPPIGFFTTRFIDAANSDLAAELAVEELRREIVEHLGLKRGEEGRLLIYVAGVAEVDDECFRKGRASKEATVHWFKEAIMPTRSFSSLLGALLARLTAIFGASQREKGN